MVQEALRQIPEVMQIQRRRNYRRCSVCRSHVYVRRYSTEDKYFKFHGVLERENLHISCAVYAGCDVFFTTDKKLLRTPIAGIKTMSPLNYI